MPSFNHPTGASTPGIGTLNFVGKSPTSTFARPGVVIPSLTFTFDLFYKYWPAANREPSALKQSLVAMMQANGVTVVDVSFLDVPMDSTTNPGGAKVVATVTGTSSLDATMIHANVAASLGMSP